jgi:hypothetical protein
MSNLTSVLDAGTGEIADIAKLALAGAEAIGVPLHPSMSQRLRKAS